MWSARRFLLILVAATIGAGLFLSAGYKSPAPLLNAALAQGPGDWPMMGHDAARTGYSADETVLKPPLRLAWTYETQGAISGSPAVAGGVLFAGSLDGKLYALDARTGSLRWSYATGGEIWSSPAVANGMVYFGSNDHNVYALDAATGTLRWVYQTGDIIFTSPAVADGVVYISPGSQDRTFYALDSQTGSLRWQKAYYQSWSSAAVGSGMVFAGIRGTSTVYGFDAQTGNANWSESSIEGNVGPAPSFSDPLVYVPLTDSRLVARNAQRGNPIWGYSADASVDSSLAVANGLIYMSSRAGTVFALEGQSGGLIWRYATGEAWSSSPVVANGVVYLGAGWSVHALDAQAGSHQWSYKTGGYVGASPAVANGMLYAGSEDGKLYAFENSPSPPTATPLPAATATATAAPAISGLSVATIASDKSYPGEVIAYTILLDNGGSSPISVTLTDTIPSSTSYIMGTLVGGTYNASINSIQWSGAVPTGLSSLPSKVLQFRVKVEGDISNKAVTNTALLSNGSITVASTTSTKIWRRTSLPLLLKGATSW